ncbi:MAG TPA: hypothetical protein VD978_31045 [Azospirillum sp.]|nr:hypothetical protein [Azospirillum sp.]
MDTRDTHGTRVLHFRDAREAESFVYQEGFQYQGAPGRWQKVADGEIVRADIHIGQYGTVVVIYLQPRPRPMSEIE